jgi:hypothetical protein
VAALAILALTIPTGRPFDFCTYYSAGSLANDTGPAAAYDLELLNRRHGEVHSDSGRRVGSFYYSPLFLVPASLLARLDLGTAQMLNQMLMLLALGGIFYLVLEQERPKWLLVLLFVVFIASGPVRIQFLYQNWTVFLVLVVALALRQTVCGADRSAAVLWALAFHLKLFAGLFLVPLWLIGKRGIVARSLALFVLLLALLLPWTGFEGPLTYLGSLAEEAGGGMTVFRNQISLPAALARLARPPIEWVTSNDPVDSLALRALVWLSLGAFVFAVWKLRKDSTRALALTVPYLLLFLPKMWDHGQLLFLALFVVAVLPRRLEVFAAAYLILSGSYFPLVEDLLLEVLREEASPLRLQALLLFYPLLNLLAAASLLQGEKSSLDPERAGSGSVA